MSGISAAGFSFGSASSGTVATYAMHDAAQAGDPDLLQTAFDAFEDQMDDEYDPSAEAEDVGIDDRDCWEATVLHTAIMHA